MSWRLSAESWQQTAEGWKAAAVAYQQTADLWRLRFEIVYRNQNNPAVVEALLDTLEDIVRLDGQT